MTKLKPQQPHNVRISIRVPEQLKQTCAAKAKTENLTLTQVIIHYLQKYADK